MLMGCPCSMSEGRVHAQALLSYHMLLSSADAGVQQSVRLMQHAAGHISDPKAWPS